MLSMFFTSTKLKLEAMLKKASFGSYLRLSIPKREQEVTKAMLERTQKGIGYQKIASSYVFRRVQ